MSTLSFFEDIAQLIVGSRVEASDRDLREQKAFRGLIAEWRSTVQAAFEHAGASTESGWKHMTVHIYYHPSGDKDERTLIERWYFFVAGKNVVSQHHRRLLYRSLFLHLRLLPLARLKAKTLSSLPISYKIIKERPLKPLGGPSKSISIYQRNDATSNMSLQTDYLLNIDHLLSESAARPRSNSYTLGRRPEAAPPAGSVNPATPPAGDGPADRERRRSRTLGARTDAVDIRRIREQADWHTRHQRVTSASAHAQSQAGSLHGRSAPINIPVRHSAAAAEGVARSASGSFPGRDARPSSYRSGSRDSSHGTSPLAGRQGHGTSPHGTPPVASAMPSRSPAGLPISTGGGVRGGGFHVGSYKSPPSSWEYRRDVALQPQQSTSLPSQGFHAEVFGKGAAPASGVDSRGALAFAGGGSTDSLSSAVPSPELRRRNGQVQPMRLNDQLGKSSLSQDSVSGRGTPADAFLDGEGADTDGMPRLEDLRAAIAAQSLAASHGYSGFELEEDELPFALELGAPPSQAGRPRADEPQRQHRGAAMPPNRHPTSQRPHRGPEQGTPPRESQQHRQYATAYQHAGIRDSHAGVGRSSPGPQQPRRPYPHSHQQAPRGRQQQDQGPVQQQAPQRYHRDGGVDANQMEFAQQPQQQHRPAQDQTPTEVGPDPLELFVNQFDRAPSLSMFASRAVDPAQSLMELDAEMDGAKQDFLDLTKSLHHLQAN